jgi:hypothetical protein
VWFCVVFFCEKKPYDVPSAGYSLACLVVGAPLARNKVCSYVGTYVEMKYKNASQVVPRTF